MTPKTLTRWLYAFVVVLVVFAIVLIGRGAFAQGRSAAPHSAERLSRSAPTPVVLWIGGGGWVDHQAQHSIRSALHMHGVITRTVNYAGSDTMYQDVINAHADAAAFARANGREFYVIGHSAGGHMAAWLAQYHDDAELYINLGGPLDPVSWLHDHASRNGTDESRSIRQVQQRHDSRVTRLRGDVISFYQHDDPVTGWQYDSIQEAAAVLTNENHAVVFDTDPGSDPHWFNGEGFIRMILGQVLNGD